MKSLIYMIVSAFIILASCAPAEEDEAVINLKENEAIRDSIYSQIINDQKLFNEFMIKMMADTNVMYRMMDHQGMMGNMMMGTMRDTMRYRRWQQMMRDSNFHRFMDSADIRYMDSMHNRMMNY